MGIVKGEVGIGDLGVDGSNQCGFVSGGGVRG